MRGKSPGILAIFGMGLVALLAHGVPGVAGDAPSKQYMDQVLRAQLRADEELTLISDGQEFPPALRESFQKPTTSTSSRRAGPFTRDYRRVAYREARRAGIKRPMLFVRQMAAESGFQPCARSGAGAIGIAQIMPATAHSWNVDPYQPESALRVAAIHMATYERQLGSYRLALAAYNAGPGAVRAYGGVPPYPETRTYINRVMDRSYPLPGMRQVFHLPGGMQTGFATRLKALQRDVRRHGGRLKVSEGWRSYEDQLRIWKVTKRKYGWEGASVWAAPPGCSNHGRGYAADLRGSMGLAHQLAGRHGLVFPMAHEPWHVELQGIASQSGR